MPSIDVQALQQRAAELGYAEVDYNIESSFISFRKDGVRVNVYYTTGTVGTCLAHPTQGKTQLFRRARTQEDVYKILDNPRVHTGAGYYTKKNSRKSEPFYNTLAGHHFSTIVAAQVTGIKRDFSGEALGISAMSTRPEIPLTTAFDLRTCRTTARMALSAYSNACTRQMVRMVLR